jgi:outer membrane protein assembly factor BamB
VEFDARTNVAWTVDLPYRPILADRQRHQLFLTAANDNELLVLSYHTRSGKRAWTQTFPRARRSEIDGRYNDPASPTPVTNGRAVYAFFPDLGLVGLSATTGKLLWKLPLPGFVNNYGMASSPVLYENTLYLQCDQTHGSFVIAVDARTGRVRWRKERDKNVLEGWSTPLILAKSGELLAVGSSGLEAMDAATGQTRWSVPTGGGLMIPAPILPPSITRNRP